MINLEFKIRKRISFVRSKCHEAEEIWELHFIFPFHLK